MDKRISLWLFAATIALAGCSQEAPDIAKPAAKPSVTSPQSQVANYEEGVDYRIVSGIDIEGAKEPFIVEYFWLGCPHCQKFEAPLQKFISANPNFEVVKKPAAFSSRWVMDARIYYGMEKLGKLQYLNQLFDQYRDKPLPNRTAIGSFLQGIDIEPDEFYKMIDASPEITEHLNKNHAEMKSNEINGVPGIVVNGKYLIISKDANFFELVKYLGKM